VLSELPGEWRRRLNSWARWNVKKKKLVDRQIAPDRNEEIFLYETLLGAWPLAFAEIPAFGRRMKEYVIKATREAMVHTRWTRPNQEHERALTDFVAAIIKPAKGNLFLADFLKFHKKIAYFGMLNGLAQLLLKLTSPGVPDIYQGCELWDLRLVDPDNRAPVDFERRTRLLEAIENRAQGGLADVCRDSVQNWQDGRAKLYLTWKVLNLRREHRELFSEGSFVRLPVSGKRAKNLIAFARRRGKQWALTIVPRWLAYARAPMNWSPMAAFWRGTKILLPANAPTRWESILSGGFVERIPSRTQLSLRAEDVLGDFPVACLHA
jgi:(1->4)-alpha-D-glucan 1-alpha-D-glucosylmutase